MTKGQCSSSVTSGLLLTISQSDSDTSPISNVEKCVCIDLNHSTFVSKWGSGLDVTVNGLKVLKDGDNGALVLSDKSSIYTLELIYNDLPKIKNIHKLGFLDNRDLELVSVTSTEKTVTPPAPPEPPGPTCD